MTATFPGVFPSSDVTGVKWTSGQPPTLPKPPNLANGNVELIVAYNQVAASSFAPPDSQFTTLDRATVSGSRGLYAFEKPITNAAGESTYGLATSGGTGRGLAFAIRGTGFLTSGAILDGTPGVDVYSGSSTTTLTLNGTTVTDPDTVLVSVIFANTFTGTVSIPGFTPLANDNVNASGSTSMLDVQWKRAGATGATGNVTATFKVGSTTTSVSTAGGFLIALKPAAASVPLALTATPEPGNNPPRVLLTVANGAGSSATVTRIDGAGNRTPVRAAAPGTLTGGALICYDYEAPYWRTVSYEVTDGTSTATADGVMLTADRPWLVHPGIPSLSCPLHVADMGDDVYPVNQGVFRPLGRKTAVTIGDGTRQAPTFDLAVRTATEQEESQLRALLADGASLLLQIAYDPVASGVSRTYYRWVSVGEATASRMVPTFLSELRRWTLPCTESSRPAGTLQSQRTWADVLETFSTWRDVLNTYATWRDLITDVQTGPAASPTPDPVPDPTPPPPPTPTIPAMPTVPAVGSFSDRHAFSDFTQLSKRVMVVPAKALAGTDWSTTDYYMVANTSTQASQVPPQSAVPATNPLYLFWEVGSASSILTGISWHDLALIGTPQGHLYNGFMIGYADAPHLAGLLVKGIPGDSNAPPGETFSGNLWHTTNALIEGCVFDGRDASGTPVAASLIGLNNATNTTIRFCRSQYANSGMSFTAWQSSGTVLQDCDFSNSRRILNFEQCSGTADITRVNLSGQWSTSKHISCNGNLASVRMTITDPIVGSAHPGDPGSEWPLRVMAGGPNVPQYPPGSGKTNLQKQSDIKLIVDGVDRTSNSSYLVFS